MHEKRGDCAQHAAQHRRLRRISAPMRSSSGLGISGALAVVRRCMKMNPELLLPPTEPRLEKKPLRLGSANRILLICAGAPSSSRTRSLAPPACSHACCRSPLPARNPLGMVVNCQQVIARMITDVTITNTRCRQRPLQRDVVSPAAAGRRIAPAPCTSGRAFASCGGCMNRLQSIGVSVSDTNPETSTAIMITTANSCSSRPMIPPMNKHRNKNSRQRKRHRNDREPDFLRTLQRRFHRRLAHFHVAHDVFQHHDRVVHHESHRERQRHQRKVVDRVVRADTSPQKCPRSTSAARCSESPSRKDSAGRGKSPARPGRPPGTA